MTPAHHAPPHIQPHSAKSSRCRCQRCDQDFTLTPDSIVELTYPSHPPSSPHYTYILASTYCPHCGHPHLVELSAISFTLIFTNTEEPCHE